LLAFGFSGEPGLSRPCGKSEGASAYWPFRPDARHVVDLTLGVLLSDHNELDILGYVALPRLLAGTSAMRLSAASPRIDLFGRTDLAFLQHLLKN